MGGDGIETTDCIDQAAGNELNINATSAGADATQIPGAKATIDAFRKAFPGPNDFGGYTMQAYDAANALMAAIGRAVNDANGSTPTREQVRAEMPHEGRFVGSRNERNIVHAVAERGRITVAEYDAYVVVRVYNRAM
jgi:ABC-type branched-subunit amino acid transport system substrate-binding protein